MKNIFPTLTLGLLSAPILCLADVTALEQRMDEMESYIIELEEKVGERTLASSFDSIGFDIGGFLHTAYTHIDTDSGSQGSFNRNNFELLVSAQLNDSWSAFIASGFLRESDDPLVGDVLKNIQRPVFNNKNKTPSIIAYANYQHNDTLNVRIGRQLTPHGIVNIEHFPASLLDTEQPQFLRPFNGNTLFPNFFTGINLHGKGFYTNSAPFYSLYLGNYNDLPNSTIGGARLGLGLFDQSLEVALNFHSGDRTSLKDRYNMAGIDVKLDYKSWLIKSEYYTTSEQASILDREAFYIQPALRFNEHWVGFFRYDTLDNPSSNGEQTENSIGINYIPSSNVQLRAIVRNTRFKDQNNFKADAVQLSGTFSF